jgi:small subunit ribosomal protein S16
VKIRLSRGGARSGRTTSSRGIALAARRPLHRPDRLLQPDAKDHADRLKIDLEKAKTWIGKGATASDRVHRFLADAGLVKPITHHNPEKMKPKKKAQERAAAAAKAAAQAPA